MVLPHSSGARTSRAQAAAATAAAAATQSPSPRQSPSVEPEPSPSPAPSSVAPPLNPGTGGRNGLGRGGIGLGRGVAQQRHRRKVMKDTVQGITKGDIRLHFPSFATKEVKL
ncbi:MAG: hypothetical protein M1826_002233 [Phylliscum demangeonii]|nr:MAG: hypothetical protein M1826_002233 [Phylliscum demangeonii]